MKDPCAICLVRVNCTQVCPEKENYVALIKTACKQNSSRVISNTNVYRGYTKYRDMHQRQVSDKIVIAARAARIKRK